MRLFFFYLCITLAYSHDVKDFGLCSQIYQMHQYCTGISNETVVKGPPGPRGPPGIVDYAAIKAVIDVRIAALQMLLEQRQKRFEQKVGAFMRGIAVKSQTDYLCDHVSRDSAEIGNEAGGVFQLAFGGETFDAFCDLATENGSWLVFQRRMDGSVEFYRNWDDYVNGFGDLEGEFWLGLERIHKLTTQKPHELRIELEDWDGNRRYAKYAIFKVGDANSYYRLTIGEYSGDAGDSLIEISNGMSFTTIDRDHDRYESGNCATLFKGAWWHKTCHESNLNGKYLRGKHTSYADGIEWHAWTGYYYSHKFAEMKIRPINEE